MRPMTQEQRRKNLADTIITYERLKKLNAVLAHKMTEWAEAFKDAMLEHDRPFSNEPTYLADECFCKKVIEMVSEYRQETANMKEINDLLSPPKP